MYLIFLYNWFSFPSFFPYFSPSFPKFPYFYFWDGEELLEEDESDPDYEFLYDYECEGLYDGFLFGCYYSLGIVYSGFLFSSGKLFCCPYITILIYNRQIC